MAARTIPSRPRRGRLSLRAKLTGSVVVLLTVVCLIVGVVSEFALDLFLTRQIDQQLSAAANRSLVFASNVRPPDGGPPPNLGQHPLGQNVGTVSATFSGRRLVHDDSISEHGGRLELSADQQALMLSVPADGEPHTLSFDDLGEYRLMALPVAGTSDVVVTGLPMKPVDDTLLTVGLILFGVAAAGVLGAALLGAFAVRRTLRPLDRVAATAARVTELPLDRGQVALSIRVPEGDTDPRTEVGQVGSALNLMLGHVAQALEARHDSEIRVRQFVADASHELRTPLAAIRGYAELAARGSALVPPDVAHSMGRIQSEAVRMTALVEDLLLLARLDGGRPLDVREVDLTRLVADAVGDARVAGREHRWRLELPPEPVLVLGDVQRLHQVLANLLANARTHTPPGTAVVTALARSADGSAVLTVTDDGPGIAPDLLPDVFERFARGDSSRSRHAGSTGLGMAIAAAVVVAHHGTIEVHSRPGRTEFAVRLPVAVPAQRVHSIGTTRPQLGTGS
ncbi:two-component system histidine kinase [Amycolatopsis mediterranei S699]|uniref:histidine kinase n=3 Tax=Amycolatopsis mediterranei TaxID=33910 RepID=A0A0H3DCN5_AMYMU|nr:HAMP domain-containing sensor histidine kinase [Amycolatopsis mediterranei]ADJ48471.1 two-component system histidine kinase [Amycolatopsis mediterranei U32]AEK45394.1 two-component system histidine kinase [Amycolatopsis mediterranei S699]AFO80182.1 two-component system histidine kinase [Amycolatopsis mediterranei S699]AGT87310.1 two-component system histidine kinase [Amycolatopsis mediterranei RB]KDO10988.1 histidine kinase [Amycolatopsis mediterranei]